jgi:maleylpyruvate isomerase
MRALEAVPIDDALVRSPSALPGWTIGHVFTHLARNADSHTRMIDAAKAGRSVAQYPGGVEQRETEIEAGARRSASALLADVSRADDELADAYAGIDDETWHRHAIRWGQVWPVIDLPFLRWREVAVHSIDLGLPGIGTDIWHPDYVDHELRRQIAPLSARLPASTAVRLAPRDASWSTVVVRAGDSAAEAFVTIDGARDELLTWTIGRSPGEPHWPTLTPWRGVP